MEKNMKKRQALLLNGSARKNGATGSTLSWIAEHISDTIETTVVDCFDLSVKPCLGCMGCRPDKRCVLPEDDGHRVGDLLVQSDLLIVGSPSYWSNMPAPLKVLFDRNVAVLEYCLDRAPTPNMIGKKAIIVATCASPEPRSSEADQLPLLTKNISYILESSGYEIISSLQIGESWNFLSHETAIRKKIQAIAI